MSHYRFIQAEQATYPIIVLCRALRVARSAYYAWARRGVSAREATACAPPALRYPRADRDNMAFGGGR